MLDYKTSRRTFLKTSAGAAMGLALSSFSPVMKVMANDESSAVGISTFNYKSVKLENLPDAMEAARQSEMVKVAFNRILDISKTIKNTELRNMVINMLKDPQPQVAELYTSSTNINRLFDKLASAGYIKPDTLPLDKLIPPYNGNAPQPFYTAPGSGYHSHHAYPGGLATHVASNLMITESIVNTYKNIYGYDANSDIAIAGQALHDIAKPWVFQWQDNGESLKEYTIAGTGAHHVYSIAEAMYRGLPPEEVVAQACAHDHPGNPKSEAAVVEWIKAAAIIADINPISYGALNSGGHTIPTPHKQAGYIVHLGDHDFVLTGIASSKVEESLKKIAFTNYGLDANTDSQTFNHFRNFITSQISSMHLHYLLSENNGMQKVMGLVEKVVTK